jgi:hypothetical protein
VTVPTHLSEDDPRRLAVQVLVDCEVAGPPVDEARVLGYFGVTLSRATFEEAGCGQLAREHRQRPSGMLVRLGDDEPPQVWVDPDVSLGRYRWTVFHELGHHDLGHQAEVFVDGDSTLRSAEGRPESLAVEYREAGWQAALPGVAGPDEGVGRPIRLETAESARRKQEEREANLYASEMIMPSQLFVPEARELPTGIEAVQILRTRYNASFEAAAVRYAQACPERCALLAVEPIRDLEGMFSGFAVLYSWRRKRAFLPELRQDTELPFSGLLAEAWNAINGHHVAGAITANLLGLHSRVELRADALKLGSYGRVLALLWLESGQQSLLSAA